jgi:hypothetical protein
MKNMILAATVLSMATSFSALAVNAQDNIAITGLVGVATPEMSSDAAANGATSAQIGGFAWGTTLGYSKAVNDNVSLGVELGYNNNNHGKYTGTTSSTQMNSTNFDGVLTVNYLFQNGFNFFAKGGLARLMQSYDVTGTQPAASDLKAIKPEIKLGLGYLYYYGSAGSLNVYGQYTHIFATNGRGSNPNVTDTSFSVDVFSLGVSYQIPV